MKIWQFLFYPFSLLYAGVLHGRHLLYDLGLLPQYRSEIPTICVGNLSFGGSGKTPMIEFLIKNLPPDYKISVLSRGYGRKFKGFAWVQTDSKIETVGDEPFQIKYNFPNVAVAVEADRVAGLQRIEKEIKPDLILLDDAYQHRRVKSHIYILLTTFDAPYFKDFLVPSGYLRDVKRARSRADFVVVTKTPQKLTAKERINYVNKLDLKPHQQAFFAYLSYAKELKGKDKTLKLSELAYQPFTLVTGIANAKPLVSYLNGQGFDFKHLEFSDHHDYTPIDIQRIKNQNNLVLTTAKDFAKLSSCFDSIYYLTVEHLFFENEPDLVQEILEKI